MDYFIAHIISAMKNPLDLNLIVFEFEKDEPLPL